MKEADNPIDEILSDGDFAGLKTLIARSSESQNRLPMLEVIFDRLVRFLSASYRAFTAYTVDIEVGSQTSERFGDFIEKQPFPSMISVVRAIEWDSPLLVVVDSNLIYALIDILFGGRKSECALRVENRPYTSIEQSMSQSIVELLLHELSVSFEPVSQVTFQLERIESNPKFASIVRADDIIHILELSIKMEARSGMIQLIIPYSSMEPVKKLLQRSFIGERGSRDPIWTRNLENEISEATVKLHAQLNGVTSTVENLMCLQIGHTIVLDKAPDDDILVMLGKYRIAYGKMGKIDSRVAMKLSSDISLEEYEL